MLRFGLVCLAGLIGGSVCGIAILALGLLGVTPITDVDISTVLQLGVVFGGGFGVIAFPICYYLFLRDVPLWLSLAVTIPATIVVGWLGLNILLNAVPGDSQAAPFIIFGPGFLGLLLSSIALNRFAARAIKRA